MTIAEIQLYKGIGRAYYGRLALHPLLQKALGEAVVDGAEEVRFVLIFHDVVETEPIPGPPELVNMLTSHAELDVLAMRGKNMVFRKRYPVRELLGPALRDLVTRIDPEEATWAFRISHPTLDADRDATRPAPEIEGALDVDLQRPRHVPFTVTKADEPEIGSVSASELGIDDSEIGPVIVLLPNRIITLLGELPLHRRIEDGGFLIGTVRRLTEDENRYVVEITEVAPAQSAGAGAGHFTFTGDSFSTVNKWLAESGTGGQLVGWYHTHPFAAGPVMGLSSVDVDLHFATFRRPWQVAGLINVTGRKRVLRFYGRTTNEMTLCEQWIANERDRYSITGTRLEFH
jgi:proteasome lid subunit RPN8/RPN11